MPIIKIFESGKYSQGNFDSNRVKEIFSKTKDGIKAIFSHTSKWDEKEPLEVGSFNDFKIKEEDGKSVVYGTVNFNEKGKQYYDDKILKGVSVEIDPTNNTLERIAVLPIGINPAVKGAEFESMKIEDVILEFEEEIVEEKKEANLEESKLIDFTIDDVIKKYGNEYNISKKEENNTNVKSETEIREELRKEFEEKFKQKEERKRKTEEFFKNYQDKLTPKIKEFLNEEVMEVIYANDGILEFEAKSVDMPLILGKLIETLPNIENAKITANISEFNNIEKDEYEKQFEEAKARTIARNKK